MANLACLSTYRARGFKQHRGHRIRAHPRSTRAIGATANHKDPDRLGGDDRSSSLSRPSRALTQIDSFVASPLIGASRMFPGASFKNVPRRFNVSGRFNVPWRFNRFDFNSFQ
jgi:hypothetical protein